MLKNSRMSGQRWARVMRDGNRDEGGTGGGSQPGQSGQGSQQGQEGAQQGNTGTATGTEQKSFPDNTPVAEMTPEQQAAYWKHHARKHEQRASQAPSQQELDELKRKAAKFDEARQAEMSDLEKANEKLAEHERKLAEFQQKEVRLQALTEAGLSLDWLENVTGTEAESAKESARRIKERLGTSGNGGIPQGYQGKESGKGSSVTAGRDLYQSRNKKTNSQ